MCPEPHRLRLHRPRPRHDEDDDEDDGGEPHRTTTRTTRRRSRSRRRPPLPSRTRPRPRRRPPRRRPPRRRRTRRTSEPADRRRPVPRRALPRPWRHGDCASSRGTSELGREVAIKRLSEALSGDEVFRERFTARGPHGRGRSRTRTSSPCSMSARTTGSRTSSWSASTGETLADLLAQKRPARPRPGRRSDPPGLRGARARARGRPRPPRHQAAEPARPRRRHAQDRGLRDRPPRRRHAAHAGRNDARNRGVPGAGAGARRAGHARGRPLLARRGDATRSCPAGRRTSSSRSPSSRSSSAKGHLHPSPASPRSCRTVRAPVPGAGPCRPARVGSRAGARAGAGVARAADGDDCPRPRSPPRPR